MKGTVVKTSTGALIPRDGRARRRGRGPVGAAEPAGAAPEALRVLEAVVSDAERRARRRGGFEGKGTRQPGHRQPGPEHPKGLVSCRGAPGPAAANGCGSAGAAGPGDVLVRGRAHPGLHRRASASNLAHPPSPLLWTSAHPAVASGYCACFVLVLPAFLVRRAGTGDIRAGIARGGTGCGLACRRNRDEQAGGAEGRSRGTLVAQHRPGAPAGPQGLRHRGGTADRDRGLPPPPSMKAAPVPFSATVGR